ncbi:MAG: stage IV sporulation protein A [Firmicutes bacterium]|nr:stage IV sporulation protein A [Bacillota bacterium]
MPEFDIYRDISERTNGEIYIGVVGPVRTGKSTFITNFMDKLVMPYMAKGYEKERVTDELPQSANGRTIMTTQPRFIPSEAVTLQLDEGVRANVRLVDCVGYLVEGASGHMEGDKARMVRTPWDESEIPFERAAEIGTKRVITEHSTIGIVMTSDGTITTELPRKAYALAEERAISELKALGKPFIIILNSMVPASPETMKLAEQMSDKYGTTVVPMDVLNLGEENIKDIFKSILYEFPLRGVDLNLSKWLRALPFENSIIAELRGILRDAGEGMNKMRDYPMLGQAFGGSQHFSGLELTNVDLGSGRIIYEAVAKPDLFYRALSSECGQVIDDDFTLMSSIKGFVEAKRSFDKLSPALEQVMATGYGVVRPALDEMTLDEPQIVRQGSRYGVKLRATAPSLHIMRVDIESEVNPIVGTEQQSEELVRSLLARFEDDPRGIWQTDIFGRSLHGLVNDGLNNKLMAMPEDTQRKMRRTLSRIVNEGKGGIICILL